MCKEEQRGSPSFVCEPAWLGFSICISFEAGGWQKHQSLQAHCVACTFWHTPLTSYSIITHSYSLLAAPQMNVAQRKVKDKCALLECAFTVNMCDWIRNFLYLQSSICSICWDSFILHMQDVLTEVTCSPTTTTMHQLILHDKAVTMLQIKADFKLRSSLSRGGAFNS